MASKTIEHIEVHDAHNDVRATIPIGTAVGDAEGPTLGVIGAVHGTEYAAHQGVREFWERLDASRITGRVIVSLVTDMTAFTRKSAYLNPVDGKNLNRVWPGREDGTLTELIAHAVTQRVVEPADAVIDAHGGEWDEAIDLFIITHFSGDERLDRTIVDLAKATGFPYIEVTDARGPVLGAGTGSGTAVANGTPALTLEAGGECKVERRHVSAIVQACENAMRHMGIAEGPLTAWAGEPVVIDHGILVKCAETGILQPAVVVGDWIEAGELFTEVYDYTGTLLEQVRAEEGGVVLDVITAKGIAGGFVGKIGVCAPRTVAAGG